MPFENLDIHLGVPIELDEDRAGGQGDRRPRRLLLRAQRRVRGAAAGARRRGDAAVRRGVRAVRLRPAVRPHGRCGSTCDEPWLADVGFGRHSIHPLRLSERGDQADPGGTFRLVDAGGGDLDVLRDGTPQYRVEARARRLADYAPTCWWQQTWPSSHFRSGPVASLQTADGQVTVAGRTLIRTVGTERTETPLGSDAEVLAAYREHLGIELDRVPCRGRP